MKTMISEPLEYRPDSPRDPGIDGPTPRLESVTRFAYAMLSQCEWIWGVASLPKLDQHS